MECLDLTCWGGVCSSACRFCLPTVMLFGLVTTVCVTVCVEGKGARLTLGARSWKQRSMQIRHAKLCRVVSHARGQASRRSTGQDCRGATNMILAGRWPPVQLASDAQCYRERINRERAHRRPERPQTTATAVPLPYNVPNPMYSWKPLTRTQKVLVPLSPRGAEPRSFGRVDGAQVPPRSELLVPTMVPTTSVPFTQFSTKPFRVEYSTLPQRARTRNVFNSYVEHSTASVARPAAIWPARAP
jgi:hypothetical protein